jgi:hypothetical protein
VLSIVEAHNYAATAKVKAKKQLHETADVEMANATKPGPLIQSMINKAVAARIKKPAPKKAVKKVRHNTSFYTSLSDLKIEFEGQQEREEEDDFSSSEKGAGGTSTLSPQGRATKMGPKPNKGKGKGKGKN